MYSAITSKEIHLPIILSHTHKKREIKNRHPLLSHVGKGIIWYLAATCFRGQFDSPGILVPPRPNP